MLHQVFKDTANSVVSSTNKEPLEKKMMGMFTQFIFEDMTVCGEVWARGKYETSRTVYQDSHLKFQRGWDSDNARKHDCQ